jgi:membrane-associated phospholipid phosphatase
MVRKGPAVYSWIISSFIVLAVILGSIRFLDAAIAIRVMRFLQSLHSLHKATEDIPDLLVYIVCLGTIILWIIYFYRSHEHKHDIAMKFLKLAATVLPVAYLLKSFFQFMFGRTHTRMFVQTHYPLRFHWFHEFGFGCFPSGHMTVFTAFGIAVWLYYPHFRRPVLITLLILGAALIATDYHFLSDVIAGAYLGVLITYFFWYAFNRLEEIL